MKITDNKPKSIHLRLSENQFQFLAILSEKYKMSISDIIRLIIDDKRVLCREGMPHANNTNYIEHQL